MHHDLASRLDVGEPLVLLAEKGLRWHFPTTRDLCYQFLLEVVKADPERYEDKLQFWVNSMSRIKLDDVIWDRGEPYFPVENQPLVGKFLLPRGTSSANGRESTLGGCAT